MGSWAPWDGPVDGRFFGAGWEGVAVFEGWPCRGAGEVERFGRWWPRGCGGLGVAVGRFGFAVAGGAGGCAVPVGAVGVVGWGVNWVVVGPRLPVRGAELVVGCFSGELTATCFTGCSILLPLSVMLPLTFLVGAGAGSRTVFAEGA